MAMEHAGIQEQNRNYILGECIRMIYHNPSESFSIALIRVIETTEKLEEKEIVVKGYFRPLEPGDRFTFFGQLRIHPRFGIQYDVFTYKKELPKTKDSLIRFLSSDLFQGIGKRTAEKIVNHLGENAIERILSDPSVLDQIPGFPDKKIQSFVQALRENQGFEQTVVNLSKYGIGLKLAQKMYRLYHEETVQKLEEDPYQFVFDIEGFGFRRADEIGSMLNLPRNHPMRIRAGCLYVLHKWAQDGHVYAPLEQLRQELQLLLNEREESIRFDEISQIITELSEENFLVIEESRVYMPSLYFAEEGVASQIKRISGNSPETTFQEAEILKVIGQIEEQEGLSYGEEQYEAIKEALHAKVMILTGGPGTGKTTVIKGIIDAYCLLNNIDQEARKKEFLLAAPTGRAAKRMAEATGLKAQTIHRLLGWSGEDEFEFGPYQKLSGKMIIIDEFSMVDIWLANQLLKAIPDQMQVIIVGDEDQLPSVGPGQVLTDLLESGMIKISRLKEVYRQKEGSRIIQLAHDIKNDSCTPRSLEQGDDFVFIPCRDDQMGSLIEELVQRAIDRGYHPKDIQVLAPMYKTNTGIDQLNQTLQAMLNPKSAQKREIFLDDKVYRTGDKVIQLVNQPEKGVFNGDIGEITAILKQNETEEKTEQIVVLYDGREVVYTRQELIQLKHAYCISIHKSQGSEFPIVIMPVLKEYRKMLRKNLLYTAVTRCQQSLIICGDREEFLSGVMRENDRQRNTTLQTRMKEMFDKNEEDQEELSPYDFM
ncbi:ATP-dependent DNA helicase (RecD/TraA family) [Melghiribacillus thermohalophilus]|uniref:ATP-dependent RecD2 DNA helicase n=1 Tax=Melghiribacillus thermohalophilus TaxID=1324956 RepID=A0A4V2V2Z1_9BACI|nr:ATP-dependent DNA helicase (RecD/TraA family) [Melghiribacillus thermohalophilus]